ncbi:site-specific integrase [Chamaesiphon sp. VAR_69_metabat_338]|uniref:tyrosine-type recombinase/integrase n=1 Tax=Chamaesiphon sp. VAR_69_metabat_338 TaxID=2964704 RepID=UPI00286E1923|nr:site-specific integrase [Chamaesiphon sp. VAR_69_metabat_338]
MPRAKKSTRSGKITVAINDGRLRLRVPSELLPEQKTQFVALGLDDTPANQLIAEAKILQIRGDMLNGDFDETLDKYRLKPKAKALRIADIGKLWIEYLNKQPTVKESHYDHLAVGLGKLIEANPYQEIDDALAFREWLLENTTIGMTKRILVHCNAAAEWGIKNRLVTGVTSPYLGMAGDLPQHAWELEGKPNALTLDEIRKVRAAFAEHEDINIENYAMFVDFLFLTGCRPSEAIGLRVCDIAPDRSHITFNGAIVRVQGRAVRTTGSKNNKSRKFPINRDLEKLLDEAIWDTFKPEDLIFTSLSGKTILYTYFAGKIWKPVVMPIIGRDSTPYSCRDSFITHQLAGNMSPSNVCAWCDTSIPVIQKRYLDPSLALEVQPLNLGEIKS